MTELELQKYLKSKYPKEAEHCEWKEFKSLKHSVSGKAGDDVISYISAISNMEGGHLIIGIEDGTLTIIGVQDLHNYTPENIKLKILEQCPNLSSEGFRVESFESSDTHKIVWIFHIPKHLPRKPVLAHNRKWQRIEDSLVEMRKEREDAILFEAVPAEPDWFAEVLNDVAVSELDKTALQKAKEEYKKKNPNLASQVDSWNSAKFLEKAHLSVDGKLTKATILLLGTEMLAVKLNPFVAQITYDSRDEHGTSNPGAAAHIRMPFILAADKLQNIISNPASHQMPAETAFPEKVNKYDNWVIREALHNCIAHQDYFKKQRILVIEHPNYLLFENVGNFIPGSVEKVIEQDAPQRDYRNTFLCDTMVELNMIDTVGSGIKRMFTIQRERSLPLPDFDLSQSDATRVKIYSKEINSDFSYVLRTHKNLSLKDVISLDKVQKHLPLKHEEVLQLRNLKLIEGNKPNYRIADMVGSPTSFGKSDLAYSEFKDRLIAFIKEFGKASRADIETLFMPLMSDDLNLEKKKKKLTNMLYKFSKEDGGIHNTSDSTKYSVWVLVKDRKDGKAGNAKSKKA
jgi:ATP-dependent DNA helicase RecG